MRRLRLGTVAVLQVHVLFLLYTRTHLNVLAALNAERCFLVQHAEVPMVFLTKRRSWQMPKRSRSARQNTATYLH